MHTKVETSIKNDSDAQLSTLRDSYFDDFEPMLKTTWEMFSERVFDVRGETNPYPVVMVEVNRNVLTFKSALAIIGFTTGTMPTIIRDETFSIKNTVVWKKMLSFSPETRAQYHEPSQQGNLEDVAIIFDDILGNTWTYEMCPVHLVILLLQLISYFTLSGYKYTGTERNVVSEFLDGKVMKASFRKRHHLEELYIDMSAALDDWNDFIARAKSGGAEIY